ncbi:hypothetical protein [Actinomadura sp. 21ATH]|uniref:hypothetical protein n=1 Tax=Actinomadura sp. 21ATH TaxID=1735444 RepID=UPI0035C1E875
MLEFFVQHPAVITAVVGIGAVAVRSVWPVRQTPRAIRRVLRVRVGSTVVEYRSSPDNDGAGTAR